LYLRRTGFSGAPQYVFDAIFQQKQFSISLHIDSEPDTLMAAPVAAQANAIHVDVGIFMVQKKN
jgi:hypothetical protein